MGLWQKLFGWLNPSAPTAAQAPGAADHASAPGMPAHAPQEPGFHVAHEPAFDPHADLAAPAQAADAQAQTPQRRTATNPTCLKPPPAKMPRRRQLCPRS